MRTSHSVCPVIFHMAQHMNTAHATGQLELLNLVTSYNHPMVYSYFVAEN